MIGVLAAAALAAATPLTAAPAPPAIAPPTAMKADPAMFVVRDADTTIYLFGTFHALDGNSEWFNERGARRIREFQRAGP